jgi:sec-independent protein translocase protein TatA
VRVCSASHATYLDTRFGGVRGFEAAIDPPAFAASAPEVTGSRRYWIGTDPVVRLPPGRWSRLRSYQGQIPLTFFGVRDMFPGPMQMVLVLFIILLLFGGSKVPSLMRNLGRGANEFKRGLAEGDDDSRGTLEEKEKQHV